MDFVAHVGLLDLTPLCSTLNGDVKVTEIVNPPDANGVYEATVQMKTPRGDWVDKVNFRGEIQKNTMFPQNWDAAKIQAEVDSAWAKRSPVDGKSDMWIGQNDSGVEITGYTKPRATSFPFMKEVPKNESSLLQLCSCLFRRNVNEYSP